MTTSKKLKHLLKNKTVLILEDDTGMYGAIGNFHRWIFDNKILCNIIFDISSLSVEYIIKQIQHVDVICFETTFLSEISKNLYKSISELTDSKIIIECYVNEPRLKRKPKEVVHDIYTLYSYEGVINPDEWTLEKII